MNFNSYSYSDLIQIIEALSLKFGESAHKVIKEVVDSIPKTSGVYITFMDEEWIIEMDYDKFKALERALDSGKRSYVGACCGQTRCYVCEKYGEIKVCSDTLNIEFKEAIPSRDLEKYSAPLDSVITPILEEWIEEFEQKFKEEGEEGYEEEPEDEEEDKEEDKKTSEVDENVEDIKKELKV